MTGKILSLIDCVPWPGRDPATICSWRRFRRDVRNSGVDLLARLEEFPGAVLVSGCQRSGTTALARALTASSGMVDYRFGRDDELDAALILSGSVDHAPTGRYCFQTTYVNERYVEYLEHKDTFQLIWVIRNPYSVVYSMMYNWGSFAFDELFEHCGRNGLDAAERESFRRFGKWALPKVRRACLSYNAKTSQLFELKRRLPSGRLLVVDYDQLVTDVSRALPAIHEFIGLEYRPEYRDFFRVDSVAKANRLTSRERATVTTLSAPVYERARAECTSPMPSAARSTSAWSAQNAS